MTRDLRLYLSHYLECDELDRAAREHVDLFSVNGYATRSTLLR